MSPSPPPGPGTLAPGPILVGLGIVLVVVGALASAGALSWFGHLPGDIRIERGATRFQAPIVSMLLVSLAFSVLVRVIARVMGR